jgi:hypothetical protein
MGSLREGEGTSLYETGVHDASDGDSQVQAHRYLDTWQLNTFFARVNLLMTKYSLVPRRVCSKVNVTISGMCSVSTVGEKWGHYFLIKKEGKFFVIEYSVLN